LTMIYPIIIPVFILGIIASYFLIRHPEYLIYSYLILVPVLPPLQAGSIELSSLDLLTVPTIICLLLIISRQKFRIRGRFTIGLFLYVAAACLSYISFTLQHSMFQMLAFFRLIRLIEMFLPILLASQILYRLEREKVIRLFLIGGGLAGLIGILMFVGGVSLRDSQSFSHQGLSIYRAGGTHGGSGSFGNLMAISSLLAFWVLMYSKTFKDRVVRSKLFRLAIISGVITSVGLLVSLSRAGIVYLMVGVFVLIVPLIRKPGRLVGVVITTFLVLIALVIFWDNITQHEMIGAAILAGEKRLLGMGELSSDFESVSSHRNVYWEKSWNLYSSKMAAWPLGLGYKALKIHYEVPPDNNYMQSLFEMGVFGLMSLLAMVILGFRAAWLQMRQNFNLGLLIFALWLGYMLSMFSGDYLTCWHNVTPLFLLLMVVSENVRKESSVRSECNQQMSIAYSQI
jgi:O-antigen ligase